MKTWKRLIPYLLLNILVSAATTLGVLYWWDSTHAPVSKPGSASAAVGPGTAALAPVQTPTLPALDVAVVQIENVFGPGDLETEAVQLKRVGDGELWMTGWQLKDKNGNLYTFPQLLLNKDAGVEVYTKAGPDTVMELHWGLEKPVWSAGEEVRLFDPEGNLRAKYVIP